MGGFRKSQGRREHAVDWERVCATVLARLVTSRAEGLSFFTKTDTCILLAMTGGVSVQG